MIDDGEAAQFAFRRGGKDDLFGFDLALSAVLSTDDADTLPEIWRAGGSGIADENIARANSRLAIEENMQSVDVEVGKGNRPCDETFERKWLVLRYCDCG